jgi:hypothetical protein
MLESGGKEAKGRGRVEDLEGEVSVKRRRENVYRGKDGLQ